MTLGEKEVESEDVTGCNPQIPRDIVDGNFCIQCCMNAAEVDQEFAVDECEDIVVAGEG